ncbi:xyloside transporter [Klebsiella pneumoniae]|uniref:Xyloside transporter n=1 Tax=Klebsiella pneumoniae TaxID=573 RepID=A0A4P0XP82_KLEPN|nr:xyloside transporter [Klebsiella pneumoniae]
MSKNIMHSRHDEYHKLTRGERIGYGMGDFAQNLVFGTIGGFLALHMLTVILSARQRQALFSFCPHH